MSAGRYILKSMYYATNAEDCSSAHGVLSGVVLSVWCSSVLSAPGVFSAPLGSPGVLFGVVLYCALYSYWSVALSVTIVYCVPNKCIYQLQLQYSHVIIYIYIYNVSLLCMC